MSLCVACGDTDPAHLDHHHLVPRVRGGGEEDTNMITLCRACHGKLHGVEWDNDHGKLVKEGMERARANGVHVGRPQMDPALREQIEQALRVPGRPGVRVIARRFGCSPTTVQYISRQISGVVPPRLTTWRNQYGSGVLASCSEA